MRAWDRFIYVFASVPVIALTVAATPAEAAGDSPPPPYVIAIDPGHGGAYNPNAPDMPFDPGAIGVNGLLEKTATLDIALDLRSLLQQDDVEVLMTRTSDVNRTVDEREAVANAGHAALFISIHLNSFTDPSASGALVLYPRDSDLPFAQVMSAALEKDLSSWQISNDGVTLRDNWWTHAQMPTVTVEGAYLSNPREAQLLSTVAFRKALAGAIRDGIEKYAPQIVARKAAIEQWKKLHPPPPPATRPSRSVAATPGGAAFSPLEILAFAALLLVVLRWPRLAWRFARTITRQLGRATARTLTQPGPSRRANRRRRQAVLARSRQAQENRYANSRPYDELVGRSRREKAGHR